MVPSRDNLHQHQYYREYFDKPPKKAAFNYRFKYARNAAEMPGIVPLGRCEPISYHRVPYGHHVNTAEIYQLRQPAQGSKAFPRLEEHFERALNWKANSTVDSKNNIHNIKSKRQYFDNLLSKDTFECYAKITPVRSAVQSMALLQAVKRVD